MRIIDTHLHTIDRSRLSYPWLASVPALDRDFSYETYAEEALRAGVTDALHMEVDVAPDDIEAETDHVGDLMRRPGSIVRGAISSCRPEQAGFAYRLEHARASGIVRGFRRVLHVVADDLSESRLFRASVARLAGTGLPFDLCVLPRQMPRIIALVDACPDVQFVLDHCGTPAIAAKDFESWREPIAEIALRPNVAVKISGLMAYTAPGWSLADLSPYVEHAIGAFGWDRVVWGGDWPVCTLGGSLSTWVAASLALTAGCSVDEREKLFERNARRIWRLD